MERNNHRRYLLVAVKGIFYLIVLLAFCDWSLMMTFSGNPRTPVPSQGKIYPFNEHGVTGYVTRFEHEITDFRVWISLTGLGMFVGFCGQKLEKTLQRR
jgi:hypothetical protein